MTSTATIDTSLDVWTPGSEELKRSRLMDFVSTVGCDDIASLHDRARRDPVWFWGAATDWLQLDWQAEPSAVADQLTEPHATRWFPDGRLNLADNAVDRWVRRGRGAEAALLWEDENGTTGSWTFDELLAEVDRVGHGLLETGVRFGDTVGIQLPMVREAVVAQLACAKIGVISVPIFSGFGAGAVAERLRIAGASAHIVANGFDRRGRVISLREQSAQALETVPTLRTTVVVPLVDGPAAPRLPGEVSWADLGRDSLRDPLTAAPCPTDHPLLIAFTSGTTGAPKGVVLGHAGFAVKAGSDAAFAFDIGPGDVACWITDPGWIMSPITVLGGLITGSAVAVYGGSADFPDAGRLWRVVRDQGITMLGVSPTLIRSLMGNDIPEVPDLGSLRVFASSGEPWTPEAYGWLFERIGRKKLPVINYSGGTELSGAILSNTTAQPIHPCGFAGPMPGMGADIVDADGMGIGSGLGELALRSPSPGMPLTFWGAHDRYRTTYWTRWEGTWFHGDWVEVDDEGVWYIRGRSDDTLKIAGKRLGPAEVEAVVNGCASVSESAAIGVPDAVKGEALVVFARVPGADGTSAEVAETIAAEVVRRLGKPLAPKVVHVVDDLPRTRSGKILRRLIRTVYVGDQPGDISSLENPEALDMVRRLR